MNKHLLKKISILILNLILPFSIFASVSYDPTQLAYFYTNNVCPACNLSGAPLDFGSNGGENPNHSGANLTGAILNGAFSQDTEKPVNLSHSDFTKASLINVNFSKSNLALANFSSTYLDNANLMNTNLTNAIFTNASLKGTNFRGAILYGAIITQAQLAEAASICDAIMPDGRKVKCS